MIYINMPIGAHYGWALCGYNLIRELRKLTDVGYISDGFEYAYRDSEMDGLVKDLKTNPETIDAPMIFTLEQNHKPYTRHRGTYNVGYTFIIEAVKECIDNMKEMDRIIAGSKWCANLLKENGIDAVSIPQGVDTSVFKPKEKPERFKDVFVIFSGGKFEHRKGQDLVIEAVEKAQEKHKDIVLVALWNNIFLLDTTNEKIRKIIEASKIINVLLFPVATHASVNNIMNQSDIGIFPNRVEGGTNLVLMEYLATAKPVIADGRTGQADVLHKDYAFYSETVDDIVDHIEYAYNNREKLPEMGMKARAAMSNFSWKLMAERFMHEVCVSC